MLPVEPRYNNPGMKVLGQLSSWSCLASSCFRLSEKKETVEMREFISHFHCLLFVNTLKLMTLPQYRWYACYTVSISRHSHLRRR